MAPSWKSHIVISGSIEHRLLASASVALPRTRRKLLVIAIEHGLKLYDDQTVTTALKRLLASELFQSSRYDGSLLHYALTPKGEQVLQILADPV